jgi:signal transduction histidine kinase
MIAAPALALAVLGLRAAQAERIEARERLVEQQRQSARLSDASIAAALDDIEYELRRAEDDALGEGSLVWRAIRIFSVSRGKTVSFPREKVFFSESEDRHAAAWPLAVDEMTEQAMSAESSSPQQAAILYRRLMSLEPRLRPWAEMRLAWMEYREGRSSRITDPAWAESNDRGPMGSPVALLVCAQANEAADRQPFLPLMQRALERLRGDEWWLSYDERRFYDAMIREMLENAGRDTVADESLEELAAIERLISALSLLPGSAEKPLFERTEAGVFLIVLQSVEDGAWKGAALSGAALYGLLDEKIGPILKDDWRAAVRDSGGVVLWGEAADESLISRAESLRAVSGWEMVFAESSAVGIDRRTAMWVGFIVALVVMLAAGLALTARVVRREKELAEMQNEFIAAVSHEFKSPITSMRLLVERLASGRANADQSKEYREAMGREMRRLERHVNHLLDARQLQEGRRQYDFALSPLIEVVRDAIAEMRPQAEAKGIKLETKTEGEMTEIEIDRAALTDAIENLLDNAIRYSPSEARVRVELRRSDHHLSIDVIDEGRGIEAEDLPRVFDRFYRARQSLGGTGLGLWLVKAIAEAHGGSVEAESSPGQGSRFTLRLPVDGGDANGANSDRR